MRYKCTTKFKNRHGQITGYELLGDDGQRMRVVSLQLKEAIRSGKVEVTNLKLTADGRLISAKAKEVGVEYARKATKAACGRSEAEPGTELGRYKKLDEGEFVRELARIFADCGRSIFGKRKVHTEPSDASLRTEDFVEIDMYCGYPEDSKRCFLKLVAQPYGDGQTCLYISRVAEVASEFRGGSEKLENDQAHTTVCTPILTYATLNTAKRFVEEYVSSRRCRLLGEGIYLRSDARLSIDNPQLEKYNGHKVKILKHIKNPFGKEQGATGYPAGSLEEDNELFTFRHSRGALGYKVQFEDGTTAMVWDEEIKETDAYDAYVAFRIDTQLTTGGRVMTGFFVLGQRGSDLHWVALVRKESFEAAKAYIKYIRKDPTKQAVYGPGGGSIKV